MTRSWISDTPDEVEHPPVPLGINEMVVPRISILLSISTVIVILLSSIWIGLDAHKFLNNLEDSFESVDESMIEMDGSCLLYTSPSPRDATLSRMPSSA